MLEVYRNITPELAGIRPDISISLTRNYSPDGHKILSLDKVGFPGLILAHNTSIVHDPPRGHENSQAVYIIDCYKGNDRILVSSLRPNSQSSRHYHTPPITEIYWLLAGEAQVGERLIHERGFVINPGEVHQVTTQENGALLLILMKNAALVPEKKQHLYCPLEVGSWVKVCEDPKIIQSSLNHR